MKILVPTDLSKFAHTASCYAAKMAHEIHAEIVLIHIVFVKGPPDTQVAVKMKDIEDKIAEHAQKECIQLAHVLKAEFGVPKATFQIIKGHPVEEVIENYAAQNDIDLIIMGTKGATGFKKTLIGSNAAAVVSQSSIPVLIVPEHGRFNGIKTIVYATDTLHIEEELIKLVSFARLFQAYIHVVHILKSNTGNPVNTSEYEQEFILKSGYQALSFHIVRNDDLLDGIDEYVADVKADLIVMFTHKLTFFEKLFGKSVTRQMAFHAWTPLLSLKKP